MSSNTIKSWKDKIDEAISENEILSTEIDAVIKQAPHELKEELKIYLNKERDIRIDLGFF